jgi:hypothetical protein
MGWRGCCIVVIIDLEQQVICRLGVQISNPSNDLVIGTVDVVGSLYTGFPSKIYFFRPFWAANQLYETVDESSI